jgi:hypothetical protein
MTSPEDYRKRLAEVMDARRAIALQRSRERRRARAIMFARLWRRLRFAGRTSADLSDLVARG